MFSINVAAVIRNKKDKNKFLLVQQAKESIRKVYGLFQQEELKR
jgi:hypothetical protein